MARTPLTDLDEAATAWDPIVWDEPGCPILTASWPSPGCTRPVTELLDVVPCHGAAVALESRGRGLGALQVWLTSLATALAERASPDPAAVDLFLEAGRPGARLEQLVNSPFTTDAA